jgi:hypothetical protein
MLFFDFVLARTRGLQLGIFHRFVALLIGLTGHLKWPRMDKDHAANVINLLNV